MPTATVVKWTDTKADAEGFGLLSCDPGEDQDSIIVHQSVLKGRQFLSKGEKVEYKSVWDDSKGSWLCISCTPIDVGSRSGLKRLETIHEFERRVLAEAAVAAKEREANTKEAIELVVAYTQDRQLPK